MKFRLPILMLLIFSGLLVESARSGDLQRLDPHGAPTDDLHQMNLHAHQECKTCHIPAGKSGRLGLRDDIPGRCISCHGTLPHSGIQEHLGKPAGPFGTITCLSCHRPHRAALTSSQTHAQEYFKKPATIMMERTCEVCHKWPEH